MPPGSWSNSEDKPHVFLKRLERVFSKKSIAQRKRNPKKDDELVLSRSRTTSTLNGSILIIRNSGDLRTSCWPRIIENHDSRSRFACQYTTDNLLRLDFENHLKDLIESLELEEITFITGNKTCKVEIKEDDESEPQQALAELTGQYTVPNGFIGCEKTTGVEYTENLLLSQPDWRTGLKKGEVVFVLIDLDRILLDLASASHNDKRKRQAWGRISISGILPRLLPFYGYHADIYHACMPKILTLSRDLWMVQEPSTFFNLCLLKVGNSFFLLRKLDELLARSMLFQWMLIISQDLAAHALECRGFHGTRLWRVPPIWFSAFVMEHPLWIRVFCAEVRARMWSKNGDAAILSWEWIVGPSKGFVSWIAYCRSAVLCCFSSSRPLFPVVVEEEVDDGDEIEPPPAAVPFSKLFACADLFDWVLMVVGLLAAAAHGSALVVYLHYFAKIIHLLVHDHPDDRDVLFHDFYDVGNYIPSMATFFSGPVIGFFNCWQITLITLATGPFIVAVGGISNIFLHGLAENIQDAYAEAASIAEQVFVFQEFPLVLFGFLVIYFALFAKFGAGIPQGQE
ncbi:hypothetical protein Vadar_026318 [Vaccinium darrowii]|uniref:Uncharacterized protein n=1 Tax=Vaccinium darrowii TaxID=229202 RepID=A0ACB7YQU7_9ERIC|nr:hypothetical protein Vadar_026318 [Vaccinium darrowii]